MKYFGVKSLSSVLSILLKVGWFVVLICAICGAIFFSMVIVPGGSVEKFITEQMQKDHADGDAEACQDLKDWEKFKQAPLALKMLAFPYGAAVITLLLMIMKRSAALFDNFRKDIVFDRGNVGLMKKINVLMLIFSIITFNFSGILTCVLLFMLIEIFNHGTALQEEHDLTV